MASGIVYLALNLILLKSFVFCASKCVKFSDIDIDGQLIDISGENFDDFGELENDESSINLKSKTFNLKESTNEVVFKHFKYGNCTTMTRSNSEEFVLRKSFLIFMPLNLDSNILSFDQYASALKNFDTEILNQKFPIFWMKRFFEATPDKYLSPYLSALKYFIETPSDQLNVEAFFAEDPNPKIFSFCFKYFVTHKNETRNDILLALFDWVTDRFDFSVPRFDEYGCVSLLQSMAIFLPVSMNEIHKLIHEKEIPFSLLTKYGFDIKLLSAANLNRNQVTSYFDLLFFDAPEEQLERIITNRNVNSVIRISFHSLLNCLENNFEPLEEAGEKFQFTEFCSVQREWTFFELAFAVGKFRLANFILNHPDFDRRELLHEFEGENGLIYLVKNIYDKLKLKDSFDYLKFKAKVFQILERIQNS